MQLVFWKMDRGLSDRPLNEAIRKLTLQELYCANVGYRLERAMRFENMAEVIIL